MRIRLTPIAAAAFAMVSAAAAAQDDTQPQAHVEEGLAYSDYIAIMPGFFGADKHRVAADSTTRSQGTGLSATFLYGDQLTKHWSIEGNIIGTTIETCNGCGTNFYQYGGMVDISFSPWDRREAAVTPFIFGGVGAMYNDVYPRVRQETTFNGEAGLGLVTKSLYHGVRLRAQGQYIHDTFEGGQNDYRASLGIEIPLGRVVVHVTEVPAALPPVMTPLVKEVPRPWIDSDGDGVDDEHDLCPNTPHGLKVDAHGCVIPGQQIELNGVSFEFNKARLMVNAQTILDTLAPAFTGQPNLRVEIAGHTDSIGSAEANLKLSQARAEAVRTYLISRGARPEQIVAKGYGKTQPLVSPERTAEDRERNRRVEFRIIDK